MVAHEARSPLHQHSVDKVEAAFRFMLSGEHTGRIAISGTMHEQTEVVV